MRFATKTYFGILILCEVLVLALEFHSNLIPLLLPTILDDCLNYPACIVLKHDIFDLPPNDIHERVNVLRPLLLRYVLLACERPCPFSFDEQL